MTITCLRFSYNQKKFIIIAQNRLPDSGYFSEADPKAKVYSPLKGKQAGDITKRGDRYTSDFIWNINWQEKLDADQKKLEEELQQKNENKNSNGVSQSGFLSLNRVNEVYNVDQDLNEELSVKKLAVQQNNNTNNKQKQAQFTNPPTQAESRGWSRGGKFGKRSVAIDPNNPEEDETRKAIIQQEQMMYKQLQQEFASWTIALAAVSFAATYSFYTKQRYFGGQGLGQGIGGLVGQPRLLIPVILVISFNRWNQLYADNYDLESQLLPTLIDFFTYKGAVIARQSVKLFQEMMDSKEQNNDMVQSDLESSLQGAGEGMNKEGTQYERQICGQGFCQKNFNTIKALFEFLLQNDKICVFCNIQCKFGTIVPLANENARCKSYNPQSNKMFFSLLLLSFNNTKTPFVSINVQTPLSMQMKLYPSHKGAQFFLVNYIKCDRYV